MTEKQKMLAGKMYDASDPTLVAEREHAHRICRTFNASIEHNAAVLAPLLDLFAAVGESVHIESPFLCDYGSNITLGDRVYFNFGVTILDCARVTIGSDVKFGPGTQLFAAGHSLDPVARAAGEEFGAPITIEDGVWIGGGTIVLPNVTIGRDAVVGAGSVVTRNVEPNTIVAGNPARPIRSARR